MEITISINDDYSKLCEEVFKMRCLLTTINRKVDKLSVDVTQLNTTIDELNTEVGTAVTELSELATQIEGLEVGQITQDQVDELQHKAAAAMESLKTGVAEAKKRAEGTTEGLATVEEGSTPKPEKTVYFVNPEASLEGIDTTQYSSSGFVTAGEDPQPLYYFSGDTAEGDANGANAAYAVYTGDVVQVAA